MSSNNTELPLELDHPVQPGWLIDGLEILDLSAAETPWQFKRFANPTPIMGAVNIASLRTDSARATHEQTNLVKLLLSRDELAEYRELAGKPETIMEYLTWFGHKATLAYERLSDDVFVGEHALRIGGTKKLGKITLELAGIRQAGDWEKPRPLDALVRSIPHRLADIEHAAIETFEDPSHPKLLTYEAIPLQNADGSSGNEYSYITIRRRRMLADVALGGQLLIELFKESTGLIILGNLPPETKSELVGLFRDDWEGSRKKGSPAALLGGEIMEEAIATKAKTTTVTPLGVQNLMQVRAPKELSEKWGL